MRESRNQPLPLSPAAFSLCHEITWVLGFYRQVPQQHHLYSGVPRWTLAADLFSPPPPPHRSYLRNQCTPRSQRQQLPTKLSKCLWMGMRVLTPITSPALRTI